MSLRLFTTLLLLVGMIACTPSNKEITPSEIESFNPESQDNNTPKGTAKFVDTVFDFGNIHDGDVVQHTFKFINVGEGPLTVAKVEASCGCTSPEWTKEVIPPGGEGKVVATFDSKGRGGVENPLVEKNIDVLFENATNGAILLVFKARIKSTDNGTDNHSNH
jgi:hypothetical protein